LDVQPTLEDLEDEEDEEGGRFHGSGVSTQQLEILSYFDREDNTAEGEVIGREGFGERDVKKLAAGLERAVNINESRRAKFSDDPTK
jgi:beta-catenin-like protein 1